MWTTWPRQIDDLALKNRDLALKNGDFLHPKGSHGPLARWLPLPLRPLG